MTQPDQIIGTHMVAEKVTYSAGPAAEKTVCTWLLTSWHYEPPLTQQWFLAGLRMAALSEPRRTLTDATHEILIVAIHNATPVTAAQMSNPKHQLTWLMPAKLAHQIVATYEETVAVAGLMAKSMAFGGHTPEPVGGWVTTEAHQYAWAMSISKTLGHMRGEVHAP